MPALTADIRLIVGLGNPGADYVHTRHNAGFWFVDLLAEHFSQSFRFEKRFNAEETRLHQGGEDIYLLKPQNFMNRSGQSVGAFARYYKLQAEQILVVNTRSDIVPGDYKQGSLRRRHETDVAPPRTGRQTH